MTVNPTTLKRSLSVTGITCEGCEHRIETNLAELPGIQHVEAKGKRGKVRVVYNPFQLRQQKIEARLMELGYPPAETLWSRIRRGWQHFDESGFIDMSKAPSHCCSKSPR